MQDFEAVMVIKHGEIGRRIYKAVEQTVKVD